jgi:hypothetical protein
MRALSSPPRRSAIGRASLILGLAVGLQSCVEVYGAACDTRVQYPPVQAEETTGLLRFLVEGTCACTWGLDGGDLGFQLACSNTGAPGQATANLSLFFTSVGDTPHVDVAISTDEIGLYSEVDDSCSRAVGYFGTFRYGPPGPPPEGWEDLGEVRPLHIEHLLLPAQDAGNPLVCPTAPPLPIEESEAFAVDAWCSP